MNPLSFIKRGGPQEPTLARKILLRILPVVVLSIFLVGLANYFVAREQISHYIDTEVRMLAQQVATSAQDFFSQRQRDLETVAETPLLRNYHTNVEYGLQREAEVYQKELREYFLQFNKRTRVYGLVAYYDREGQLVAGVADQRKIGPEVPEPELPIELPDMSKTHVYESPVLTEGSQARMAFARAVYVEDLGYCGTLVLLCNLHQLEGILRQTQIGENGRAYLRNADGEAVVGETPTGQADLHHEVPLAASDLDIVVEARAEEFLGPLKRLRNLTLLFSFAVAVLVSTMLVAGIRWAMRPVSKVTEGTRRLAEGDLDHRLPMPEVRDLKPLALAFNDMAGKLQERDQQVQARIRELSALRMMENTSMQQLNQESLLRTCLRAVADGMDFDRVGLYWIDRERDVIVGRYSHERTACQFSESMFQKQQVKIGESDVLNRVITSRQPLLVDDPRNTPGVYTDWVQKTGTSQFVLAPLCGKDEVFGIIVADNHASGAPLTEQHRDNLLLFASAAGLALENALLIERITESEARHRTVLDNSPIAILGVSRDHRIRTWNRGAETIFGYQSDQILGQPLSTLIAPQSMSQFQTLLEQLVQQGTIHAYPIKGRTQGGKDLDLNLFCGGEDKENFLANDEWTIVINDVTEARQLQDQLIKSEKLSAVGQLIAGVAHELNNPLQAVVGYTELMSEKAVDEQVNEDLQHVLDNATRCRKIVDNLLLFVRHGDVDHAPVCIQDAIEAALNLLNHRFKRTQDVNIVTDFPDEPVYIKGNFQQIEQVVINLLTNAYDALETWTGRKEIQIRACVVEGQVRIELSDTGPGVPEAVKDQLFEPLFTTKPEGRGTGLGLPLCRRIVDEHGGRLNATNREGGGAMFFFHLPMVEAPAAPQATVQTEAESIGTRRLLLLEDESAVRSLLRDVLTSEGHEVQVAENLEQARAFAAGESFDLVVTDIYLPDGTGVDFFQTWARHSSRPRPRFLFLTGDIVTEQLEQMCQESGARILQKPVNLRDFRKSLRSLLGSTPVDAAS